MRWLYTLFAVQGVLLAIITALLAAIAVLLAVVAVLIAIPLLQVMFAGGTGILLLIIATIWLMGTSLTGGSGDGGGREGRPRTAPPANDDKTASDVSSTQQR